MRKFLCFLFLGVIASAWVCADFLFGFSIAPAPEAVVPDLVGLSLPEAEALLEDAGVSLETVTLRDRSSPAGTVVKQSPAPGTSYRITPRKALTVRLTVSIGVGSEEIPDLTGSDHRIAADRLRSIGFTVREEYLPGGTAGCVRSVSPMPGSRADLGSEIVLFVDSGEFTRTVSVPDLSGLGRGMALFRLFSAGLSAGSLTEEPSQLPAGVVIRQSPAPGESVAPGTAVNLTLSKESF